MDIKILILIVAALNFALGFFIWWKGKRKRVNVSFAIFCWIVSFWSIALFFYDHPILFDSFIWIKITYVLSSLMVITAFYFAHVFPERKQKPSTISIVIYFLVTAIVWIAIYFNYFVKEVTLLNGNYHAIVYKPTYIAYSIFGSIYFFWAIGILIRKYLRLKGYYKLQLKYLFSGLIVFSVSAMIVDVIIPILFDTTEYYWFSPVFSFFFIGCVTYAITRYRLMDIKLAIKKGTAYLISMAFILAVYTGLVLYGHQLLVQRYGWNLAWTTALVVLIIALSVEPLRRLVIKVVNELLYTKKEKRRFESREKAKRYAQKLMVTQKAVTQVENVVNRIIANHLYFIASDEVRLLLYSDDTKKLECTYPRHRELSLEVDSPLYNYLNSNGKILVTQEIPYLLEDENVKDKNMLKEAWKFLRKNKVEVAVPVGEEDDVMGIFLLGEKIDGEIYTKEDIDSLKDFRSAYTSVLLNVIIYKEAVERIEV